MRLTLNVRAATLPFGFEYADAQLLARTAPTSVRQLGEDGLDIEAGTVEVGVLAATFLGASSKAELPADEEGYRARLTIEYFAEDGEGLVREIEGTIHPDDVSHGRPFPGPDGDAQLRRWTMTLRDDATDRAWERLGAVSAATEAALLEPGQGRYDLTGRLLYMGEDVREQIDTLFTYDVVAVTGACVAAAEDLEADPDAAELMPAPTFEVEWMDGETLRTHVHHPTLCVVDTTRHGRGHAPDWTGAEWVAALCAERGLRLEARYAAYPSRTVYVRLVPIQDGAVPESAPSFDGARDWDWRTEPAREPDLAATYAYIEPPTIDGEFVYPSDGGDVVRPVARTTIYAAGRWALGEDGEIGNESVIEVPFAHAHADVYEVGGELYPDGYNEGQMWGRPVITAGTGPYLFSLSASPAYGPAMLLRRQPVSPPPDAPYAHVHELWAPNLFRRLAGLTGLATARDLAELDERLAPDVATQLVVGQADGGFHLDGQAWVPEALTYDHRTQRAQLTGTRPAEAAPEPAVPPFAAPRVRARMSVDAIREGPKVVQVLVQQFTAYVVAYVPRSAAPADRIEHEVLHEGAWIPIADHPARAPGYDVQNASGTRTEYAFALGQALPGQPPPPPMTFRARTHYDLGFTSGWVEASTDD